jgi:hypothetical protein
MRHVSANDGQHWLFYDMMDADDEPNGELVAEYWPSTGRLHVHDGKSKRLEYTDVAVGVLARAMVVLGENGLDTESMNEVIGQKARTITTKPTRPAPRDWYYDEEATQAGGVDRSDEYHEFLRDVIVAVTRADRALTPEEVVARARDIVRETALVTGRPGR